MNFPKWDDTVPTWDETSGESSDPSLGQTVQNAAIGAFQRPAAYMANLGTNPEAMANAMPTVLGAGAAMAMPWGGSTVGTAAGQGIRDAALSAMDKPIPSFTQHIGELGAAAVGDVMAVPYLKKAHYASQIGKAEEAAGVVTRAPNKLPTAGNVGTSLNELEETLGRGVPGPQSARDAYATANYVTGNPTIVGKSNEINVQANRVRALAQQRLNEQVPGRLAPARGMAGAMTIPNAIGSTWNAIPPTVRRIVIPFGIMEEYMRRRHGG